MDERQEPDAFEAPDTHKAPAMRAPGMYSLRSRLLLLLAVAVVGLLGMAGYVAYRERTLQVEQAGDHVRREAERIAGDEKIAFDLVLQLLSLVAETHHSGAFGPSPQCDQLFAKILRRSPQVTSVLFALPDGDVVCNPVPVSFRLNVADRAYFAKALASPGTVIDAPLVTRTTGKWGLPAAQAVRDDAGKVHGVLVTALDLGWLTAQFAKVARAEDASIGLIDSRGTVLVRVPDPDKQAGTNASDTALFKALTALGGTGKAEVRGLDDVPRIYGFARFAETVAGPIHLWVSVSRQSVVKDANLALATDLAAGAAFAALLFALVWLGGERQILAPVAAMSDAARRIGEGDYQARTGLRYANDELGALARTFDAMAGKLASREAQFHENQAELQRRAQTLRDARTAALNLMEDAVEARLRAEEGERQLRERTAELDATNKELEAFSYSVSHDLRAPLRSIDGFSQALLEDYADRLDDEGRDNLNRVRAATQRMGRLIDDMLKLSRLGRHHMTVETVDLSALARSIAEDLTAEDPGRNVVFDIAPSLEARGDKQLLAAVLENLFGNAWKFTGRHATARIAFGVVEKDGSPAFFVKDDGAGFDMAHVGNLFTPFQRLHGMAEFPGNGIGLATVRRIVQRHGGRVWAEGAAEKGATFYFTLPAGQAGPRQTERDAALA